MLANMSKEKKRGNGLAEGSPASASIASKEEEGKEKKGSHLGCLTRFLLLELFLCLFHSLSASRGKGGKKGEKTRSTIRDRRKYTLSCFILLSDVGRIVIGK